MTGATSGLTTTTGDTKAGTLVGTDKFGNKFYENMADDLPRTRSSFSLLDHSQEAIAKGYSQCAHDGWTTRSTTMTRMSTTIHTHLRRAKEGAGTNETDAEKFDQQCANRAPLARLDVIRGRHASDPRTARQGLAPVGKELPPTQLHRNESRLQAIQHVRA